jgi:hypothetical protein
MAESAYLGAYWGGRPEPVESCADRLAAFLAGVAGLHPSLATWYLTGDSADEARTRPVGATAEAITPVLLAGQNRRDRDGSVITRRGFSAALWTGAEPGAALTVRCGAEALEGAIPNSVVLKLPLASGDALALYDPTLVRAALELTVRTWSPGWATFTSHGLRRAQGAGAGQPVLGWLTWLTSPVSGDLPAGVAAEEVGGGTLVRVGIPGDPVPAEDLTAARRALGLG